MLYLISCLRLPATDQSFSFFGFLYSSVLRAHIPTHIHQPANMNYDNETALHVDAQMRKKKMKKIVKNYDLCIFVIDSTEPTNLGCEYY